MRKLIEALYDMRNEAEKELAELAEEKAFAACDKKDCHHAFGEEKHEAELIAASRKMNHAEFLLDLAWEELSPAQED